MGSVSIRQDRKGIGLLLGHYLILIILLLAALAYRLMPLGRSLDGAIYVTCLALLGLTVWALWSWYVTTKSLFDFYVMFLLAAILFNGGHAFLEILHLNQEGILDGLFPAEVILQSLFMVLLGLAFFHFGALVVARRQGRQEIIASRRSHSSRTDYYLRLVGWILLLVSAVPTFLVLRDALRVSLSEGYFALYQQQSRTGLTGSIDLLAKFLIPSVLFLMAGSKGRPFTLAFTALVMIAYTMANFLLGSRVEAAAPLLAYAWLWHRQIRPLPVPVLILPAVGLLGLVFPFVKATRNLTGGAKLDLKASLEAFASVDNPLLAIIWEMGHSLRTVAHTIQLVPASRAFDYGLSYVYATFTVFPNLFWDVHPTIARGLAADWLVETVSPSLASIGGGYGYSFIAEAYLNFGWVGVTVGLSLIGAFLAAVALAGQHTTDPAKLALVASIGAFIFIFARGESGSIVRELVWYALVPYLVVRLFLYLARPIANRRTTLAAGTREAK